MKVSELSADYSLTWDKVDSFIKKQKDQLYISAESFLTFYFGKPDLQYGD